jgi:chromosome segregation ATPase
MELCRDRSDPTSFQTLDAKRSQLEKANDELDEQHEGLAAEVKTLTDSKERLSSDIQQESEQLERLRESIKVADSDLKGLQAQRQGLLDKGYTDEIISMLSASDAAHGGELLARVQSLEGY